MYMIFLFSLAVIVVVVLLVAIITKEVVRAKLEGFLTSVERIYMGKGLLGNYGKHIS